MRVKLLLSLRITRTWRFTHMIKDLVLCAWGLVLFEKSGSQLANKLSPFTGSGVPVRQFRNTIIVYQHTNRRLSYAWMRRIAVTRITGNSFNGFPRATIPTTRRSLPVCFYFCFLRSPTEETAGPILAIDNSTAPTDAVSCKKVPVVASIADYLSVGAHPNFGVGNRAFAEITISQDSSRCLCYWNYGQAMMLKSINVKKLNSLNSLNMCCMGRQ